MPQRSPAGRASRAVVAVVDTVENMSDTAMQVPLVDYLVLGDDPHLIPTTGVLRTFTIVAFAAPGIDVPFVSGVIDCGGTSVRGNLRGVEPDANHVHTGMDVRLTTYSLGADDNGVEAIGFAFQPA